jgi:hypothetical protein
MLCHIDFEYILGNDPKPFAPPMRLSEQMVMAMGGRRYSVYLLYWYTSTQFSCFTGTRVQILTRKALLSCFIGTQVQILTQNVFLSCFLGTEVQILTQNARYRALLVHKYKC